MSTIQHHFDNAKRRRPEDHAKQRRLTPAYIIEPVHTLLGGIDLDPCTEPDNPTNAAHFYTPPLDGCVAEWSFARNVFCNPPYGEVRRRWVAKCIYEGAFRQVVLLVPASTETQITQEALAASTSALFVRARLRFGVPRANGRQEAAHHGTVLIGFGVDVTPLIELGIAGVGMYPHNANTSFLATSGASARPHESVGLRAAEPIR